MIYSRNPTEIEAIQWTGENYDDVFDFCECVEKVNITEDRGRYVALMVKNTNGNNQMAKPFDYIVKDVKGKNIYYIVWDRAVFEAEFSSIFQMSKSFIESETACTIAKIKRLDDFMTDKAKDAPFYQLPLIEQSIMHTEKYALQAYLQSLKSHHLATWPDEFDVTDYPPSVSIPTEREHEYKIVLYTVKGDDLGGVTIYDGETNILTITAEQSCFSCLLQDVGKILGWVDEWYIGIIDDAWLNDFTCSKSDEDFEAVYNNPHPTVVLNAIFTNHRTAPGTLEILDNHNFMYGQILSNDVEETFEDVCKRMAEKLGWEEEWYTELVDDNIEAWLKRSPALSVDGHLTVKFTRRLD